MGKRAVVLGAGDIGLIVARRMIQTGTEVAFIVEKQAKCGAMPGNLRSCIDSYNIPLITQSTVTTLHGNARLEAVTIVDLDEKYDIIPESEKIVECDMLLLAVGLTPELELLSEYERKFGNKPANIAICGNAREILKMADDISEDGASAGINIGKIT